MRMLLTARLPNIEFNAAIRYGSATKTLSRIVEHCAAESVYFTESQGQRTALLVVNVDDPSQIPRLAEPWFLNFNATVEFSIAMTPDDLRKVNLEELARNWIPDLR